MVHIITLSRYISITSNIFKTYIFSNGEHIIIHTEPASKLKTIMFLDADFTTQTNKVYRGENMLVLE